MGELEEFTDNGLNANSTETLSTVFEIKAFTDVALFVMGIEGSHLKHVVTIQISPDNKHWFDSKKIIQGSGFVDYSKYPGRYIRAKVTKPEGATSVIDITFYSRGE